jgi:mono/diheme cytochrome c family protein
MKVNAERGMMNDERRCRGRRGSSFIIHHSSFIVCACLLAAGCRQEMANEPRYNPLAASDFFPDGRSARDPVPGTVPHGTTEDRVVAAADENTAPDARWVAGLSGLGVGDAWTAQALLTGKASGYVFPVRVDEALLERGRKDFNIYCSVCHDRVGTGRGKIVERGYLRPPSYHTDRLRRAPLTHFYDVVSNGYGAMPSYSDKLSPDDRWAVIAYVRALQLSQDAPVADLPPAEQEKLRKMRAKP